MVPPFNKVDEISAHRHVCYSRGVDKNDCDRKMVSELDKIPYGELPNRVCLLEKLSTPNKNLD